jgi:2-keto-4-pentenoate hydratase/2-oxohepta-3-ene-1,7-dioic acid hydratase in catechol pathway
MKLVSYRHGGREKFGVAKDDGVVDLTTTLFFGERMFGHLGEVIAAGAVPELRKAAQNTAPQLGLTDITFLLPIPRPPRILCAGRNYPGRAGVAAGETAKWPSIFGRFHNSFVAHEEPIVRPRESDQLDYEGELALVIGKRGRNIGEAQALAHVAGYTCLNEGTLRDWTGRGAQNFPGKNFDRSGSIGPWIVTADEIPDPGRLRITTRVNGEVRQEGGTAEMLFKVPFLVSYISRFTELQPGDIIATGSPGRSAVDQKPPPWLKPGDRLAVEISGIGTLANPIEAE